MGTDQLCSLNGGGVHPDLTCSQNFSEGEFKILLDLIIGETQYCKSLVCYPICSMMIVFLLPQVHCTF